MSASDTPPADAPWPTCILCYYPFSIYSILTRFAFALGQTLNPDKAPVLEVRLINLQEDENLGEDYLALNSKGQVSVRRFIAPHSIHTHSTPILSLCRLTSSRMLDNMHVSQMKADRRAGPLANIVT
jgi:hypothetical protein